MRFTLMGGEAAGGIKMSKKSTTTQREPKFFKPVFAAMLSALIILMTFTGIGYIPIGALKLTFNVVPVAVGAVLLGPMYGAILGFVFGMSSFLTCFGMDALGTLFLGINPFLLFVMCVLPRVLCGLLPALIFKLFADSNTGEIVGSAVCCMLTAVFNTVGFLGLMWLFFGQALTTDSQILELLGSWGITDPIDSIVKLFVIMAGINAIIEAGVNLVLGTAICKPLFKMVKNYCK